MLVLHGKLYTNISDLRDDFSFLVCFSFLEQQYHFVPSEDDCSSKLLNYARVRSEVADFSEHNQ